jgi:hypothetical protein
VSAELLLQRHRRLNTRAKELLLVFTLPEDTPVIGYHRGGEQSTLMTAGAARRLLFHVDLSLKLDAINQGVDTINDDFRSLMARMRNQPSNP